MFMVKNIKGQIFNGLEAVKLSHRDKGGRAYWIFKCVCKKHFVAQGYKVTSGHTRSCGCLYSTKRIGYVESVRERLMKNINKTESGCWEWKGSMKPEGYGQIQAYGKPTQAHRISYKVFIGDFDESLFVCHSCDNRRCVNPDHLFLGSAKDNHLDMQVKGRMKVGKNEKHSRAKLTVEQVKEARKLYETSQFGCSVLSKKYGVTSRTIWCAIKGVTWKNV